VADFINNVAAADAYTPALTLGPNFTAKTAVITVANNAALMQFAMGTPGQWRWLDEREFFSVPQSFRVGRIVGVRFRNANAGEIARILATLAGDEDPEFDSGTPFTGVLSASGAVSTGGLPAGSILPYAGATIPAGFVACDGAAYDGTQTTYLALWNAIGTTYGGTGQSDFQVPDTRGRVLVAKGTHVDVDTLGENDGEAVASRRPKHNHTVTNGAQQHSHGADAPAPTGGANFGNIGGYSAVTVGPGGAAPTDAPAYLVVNHMIAL
jgi:microcystin-dependent protein